MTFTRPVYFGDTNTARAEVVERMEERNRVRLTTVCVNQQGQEVMIREALLSPPRTTVAYTERKVGSAALTHWALQPWLVPAQSAATWARLGTALLTPWQTRSPKRPSE